MNHSLACILVKAKEVNKWVPAKYLAKYDIQKVDLLNLEDEGLILITKSPSDGLLLKLTLKGYHYFK
ncbi:hypothetical protein [Aquibacillus salsiterrae]|uniref:Uncharacterized protein n=1 Tax=Aquibacillus salsiterrae TaxID=2950439 RepID=A0A9X4AGE9_9BACI|nr:hypothetical protein [Aquibacillus salsiterrae]MDC3418614.1 hypothetical protein [Aquibacillus salsiterrae]